MVLILIRIVWSHGVRIIPALGYSYSAATRLGSSGLYLLCASGVDLLSVLCVLCGFHWFADWAAARVPHAPRVMVG